MIPTQELTEFPVFADSGTKIQPSDAKYSAGFQSADVLPAEWVNWLWNRSSSGVTGLNAGMASIESELVAVLTAAGITPSEATNGQIVSAINYLIQTQTGILANLSTTDKTTLVAAINEVKGSLGSAAAKTAGPATGNVPLVGTALGTTNNNFVVTDTNGNLKPLGKTTGSAAGNIPVIGTALGTTDKNIIVTDTNGALKPSGTTIGAAAGKSVDSTASTTSTNVPTTGMAISCGNAGAICSTAKATQTKTVSLSGFALYDGVTVKVMFKNGNSSGSPTLNVNGTGAIAIKVVKAGVLVVPSTHTGYWRGASSTSTEMWQSYTVLEFIYDKTDSAWVIIGNPTVESYYSSTTSYEVKADGLITQHFYYNGGQSGTVHYKNPYWTIPISISQVITVSMSAFDKNSTTTNSCRSLVGFDDLTAPTQMRVYSYYDKHWGNSATLIGY